LPSYHDLSDSIWPPSAKLDFRQKHISITSLHTLRDPILYANRKFGEDISIGDGDMPQKRNSKTTPFGGGILLPVPTLTPAVLRGPSYVSSRKSLAKRDNRRSSFCDLTILPIGAHFRAPFAAKDLKSWEDPPTPGWNRAVRPPSILDEVFLDFRKCPPVQNGGAPKWSGIEIWVKMLDFLPLYKMGENRGHFCRLLWSTSRAPPTV